MSGPGLRAGRQKPRKTDWAVSPGWVEPGRAFSPGMRALFICPRGDLPRAIPGPRPELARRRPISPPALSIARCSCRAACSRPGRLLTSPAVSPTNQVLARVAMNIKPLYDRVVIKRMEEEKMSAGGIVIPDTATEKPIKGEVVAVGEGKALDNGSLRAPKVKAGDKVLFGKYSGTEVKLDGTEYLVVKEDDILAVLA